MGIPDAFVRKATGLVRTAGTLDIFIYNAGLISLGMGLALALFFGPAFYPGGSISIASALATIGLIFVIVTFYFWSVVSPRSGGNYVFLSRGLHPAIGYALGVTESIAMSFSTTFFAATLITVGATSFFSTIGIATNNAALTQLGVWLGQPWGIFIGGTIVTALSTLLLISGMTKYFKAQKVAFVIAVIGTLALVYALLTTTRTAFISGFNGFMGAPDAYGKIISTAQQNGWTNPGFSWDATVRLIVWPLTPLLGSFFSIAIGGEIRKPDRTQVIGMLGSLIIFGALFALLPYLAETVFGYDFLGSVAYLFIVSPTASTPNWPYVPLLVGIASGQNIIAVVLVILGFVAWIYLIVPAQVLYVSRTFLAFSFDRIGPEKLAKVSDRFHTPAIALIISALIVEIWLGIYSFTTLVATLSFLTPLVVVWTIAVLTGIFLPYVNRRVFEGSSVSRYRVGRVPVMSITATIGTLFMLWMIYLLLTDPVAAGPTSVQVLSLALMFVAGLVIFYSYSYYRKRRGIDVTLLFKELPVE